MMSPHVQEERLASYRSMDILSIVTQGTESMCTDMLRWVEEMGAWEYFLQNASIFLVIWKVKSGRMEEEIFKV